MTGKKLDDGIKRTPAEDSPWGKFLLEAFSLDQQNQIPQGSHWFSAFCILKKQGRIVTFDISAIQKILHDSHFNKKGSIHLYSDMNVPIRDLIRELGNPTIIRVIDLSNVSFDKIVDFSKLIFPMDVSFKDTIFFKGVDFNKAAFYKSADFNKTQFRAEADFTKARFCRSTNFFDAIFQKNVSFMSTVFAGTTDITTNPNFNGTTFSGVANFMNVTFSDVAVFSNINFKHEAYFAESIFSKAAFFSESKFSKRADFYKVKFLNGAFFSDTKFRKDVSFDEAKFNDIIFFADTEFFDSVKFDKVKITGLTSFRNAKFKKYVPSFYKAEMYSNTIWDWDVKLWPQIDWSKINGNDEGRMIDNQNAYENLSAQMKGLDKYHDEHFFYRQEMRCRRWRSSPAVKFFYYLYEKLADYGYGIKEALWGWFWHMVLGAQAIAIVAFANACWKDGAWEIAKSMACSVPVSIANSHSFLFFNNGAFKECYKYFVGNNFFNTIWAFQTVLGIIFLFLLLLTLRIRFRLK